ncbi:MAG: hypothetical protein Q3Y08_00730 [Butyricicoccus sp.]|nr:hypothetical protein [Butyricicoccus sp.]
MTKQQRQEEEMQRRLWEKMPALIDRLIELAEDGETKPTTIVSAIKEIKAMAEEMRERLPQRVELTVKVVEDAHT